jgi:hypothetical protein
MVEVKFIVGGCEVSPDGFSDAITQAVLVQVREHLSSRLKSVSCPEHHEFARVEVVSDSIERLSFNVYGCCEKLREAAAAALR